MYLALSMLGLERFDQAVEALERAKQALADAEAALERDQARLEQAEVRVREIDETFCAPSFYQSTSAEDIKALEVERAELTREVEELMAEWEKQEEAIDERDRV